MGSGDMNHVRRQLVISMALTLLAGSALADGWYMDDNNHNNGAWVRLGRVTATHSADHDRIRVEGRNDDFRKLKFRVSDSPLNLHRIIVTYDNGGTEKLEVRENIPKGGETRDIDLQGGKRSLRTIEFWYDTKGLFNGKADVTAYGKR
jgi:hypothetical protein